MNRPEFIIYTPPWDENVGGFIALHALCARLNQLGYEAALWPAWKPVLPPRTWPQLRSWASYLLKGRFARRFRTGPFRARIGRWGDLEQAIAIYPEIVAGNPLRAGKVVRWLLYPPGAHSGVVNYASGDLVMFFNEAFVGGDIQFDPARLLRVVYQSPVYRQSNFGPRSGSCVIFRKGRHRVPDQHPAGAINVDDLSHQERAGVFNEVRYCYCYDLYTYYSVYAAVCGCTPIIIPEADVSETQWEPDEKNRLGRAYGMGRIAWAEATKDALREHLSTQWHEENEMVHRFVRTVREKRNW